MLSWRSLDEMSGMLNTSIEGVSARATYSNRSRMQTPMMGFGRSEGDTIVVSSRTGANRYGFIDAKRNGRTTLISSLIMYGEVIAQLLIKCLSSSRILSMEFETSIVYVGYMHRMIVERYFNH